MSVLFPARAVVGGLAVVTVVSSLVGCVLVEERSPGMADKPVTASIAPDNQTDPEALLERARAALQLHDGAYLQITSDYSLDASLLSPYATDEEVDRTRAFQDRLRVSGRRLTGTISYYNDQIQEYDPALGRLVILTCMNLGGTRLIDASGDDVTPPDRQSVESMQITFEVSPDTMKVGEGVVWTGSTVC
ncbi:MAG: hypothetical protein ABWZ77_05930 [Naasia sp.]